MERFGRLDILVNNAGICPRASALEYTEEMWDHIIQLNQKSVFFLSQIAAKQFLKQGSGGKIINLASMMSYLGGFNTTAYTASKHAVMGLTRVLASEWGGYGINVNALAPGWIKTDLSAPLRADPVRMPASEPVSLPEIGENLPILRAWLFCWPAGPETILMVLPFR